MSISDELMSTYFELATDVPLDEIREFEEQLAGGTVHPKTVKQRLAREIVTIYHDADAAQAAQAEFDRVHRDRQLPDDLPEVVIPASSLTDGKIWIAHLMQQAGFAQSSSDARRLVQQGGVRLDGDRITDPRLEVALQGEAILQVGKRRFAKVKI